MGFHVEALLAPRPTPKLEDHPSSAVRDCLFNLFTVTLHIGGLSSTRNLRTRHAVVTGTNLLFTAHAFKGKCNVSMYLKCTLVRTWQVTSSVRQSSCGKFGTTVSHSVGSLLRWTVIMSVVQCDGYSVGSPVRLP